MCLLPDFDEDNLSKATPIVTKSNTYTYSNGHEHKLWYYGLDGQWWLPFRSETTRRWSCAKSDVVWQDRNNTQI